MSTSSALGLVTVPGDEPEPLGVKRLFGSIGLVDLDVPTPGRRRRGLAGMRIFAGYSGWEAGQLEGEIRRGDWYVVDAEVRDPSRQTPTDCGARSCGASATASPSSRTSPTTRR